jgi:hypothetical protein
MIEHFRVIRDDRRNLGAVAKFDTLNEAKKYADDMKAESSFEYVVEQVSEVASTMKKKPRSNAIHASIHMNDTTGMDDY